MNARTWAPVLTFVAVAAAATTVGLVRQGGTPPPGPAPLRLAAGTDSQAVGAPSSSGGSGGYQLETTLSDAKPPDQRAFALRDGAADSETVSALARAFRAGDPVRTGDGWRAGGLSVSGRPGQAWSWSSCAPPEPSPPDGATAASGCAVSSGAAGATPPPDMPTAEVKDAVRAVFAAVGADVDDARLDTGPWGGSATLPAPGVAGLDTVVSVDRAGAFSYASGWLGTRTPADSYPVVSAKDAYDDLPAMAYADVCRLPPGGKDGCLPPEPVRITGAELGLSVQPLASGGSVLVPSWLFTTGSAGVIPVIAVEKAYWAPQAPPQAKPTA